MDEDGGRRWGFVDIRVARVCDLTRPWTKGDRASKLLADRGRPRHNVRLSCRAQSDIGLGDRRLRRNVRVGTIISPAPPFYRSAVVNDVADFLEPRKEDREKDDADEERIGGGIGG